MSSKNLDAWQESNWKKFKHINAQLILEWMEEASQFMRKALTPEEYERIRAEKAKNLPRQAGAVPRGK